jgi:hypothetical protein
VHADAVSGFDYGGPDAGEDYGVVRVDEVEMAFHYVGPDNFDVKEGFFDYLFCGLEEGWVSKKFWGRKGVLVTYLPSLASFEWNSEFTTNSIFEIDWLDFRSDAHEKNDKVIFALLLSSNGNTGSLAGVKSFGLVDGFADFFLVWGVKSHVLIPGKTNLALCSL